MLIFIYGEDTFRSREKLEALRTRFQREVDPSGINITTWEGKSLTREDLSAVTSVGGFLARKRMVIIRDAFKDGSQALQEGILAEVTRYEKSDNIIIFWEQAVDKRKGYFRVFSKEKYVFSFELLEPPAVAEWIKAYVAQCGSTIAWDAVLSLAGAIGNDLWRQSNEIKKLSAYARGHAITREDVALLVTGAHQERIFALVDAMVHRTDKALGMLARELAEGMAPLYLCSMLLRQVRILISLKGALALSSATQPLVKDIAQQLSLHPYVVTKSLPQARMISVTRLVSLFEQLVLIERQLKSTKIPAGALFDLLVMDEQRGI